jgi:hypothetical protein
VQREKVVMLATLALASALLVTVTVACSRFALPPVTWPDARFT